MAGWCRSDIWLFGGVAAVPSSRKPLVLTSGFAGVVEIPEHGAETLCLGTCDHNGGEAEVPGNRGHGVLRVAQQVAGVVGPIRSQCRRTPKALASAVNPFIGLREYADYGATQLSLSIDVRAHIGHT